MTVGRTRDGVPTWSGEPATWEEYRRAALLYVQATKWESRYLCGPRLAAELSGAAKAAVANKKASWLASDDGVQRLLRHLQEVVSEPVLPEVGNALRGYFKTLRRKRGETITSFCIRHREEYEKACRALTRMLQDQGLAKDGKVLPNSFGRRGSWHGSAAGASAAGTPPDDQDDDPWRHYGWNWSSWSGPQWSGSWRDSWSQADWRRHADSEDEEEMIEILPDVIKGWLLLEKAGLDTLERLQAVENSLRAHWTDDQLRRRDGTDKHQANGDDELFDEPPNEWADEYFEDWDPETAALFQEACREEHEAWAQIQEGRRTLREAREKQREVRVGRKFFGQKGRGKGQPRGRSSSGKGHQGGGGGPCLRRGLDHPTRNCPKGRDSRQDKAMTAEEQADLVFYTETTLFGEHEYENAALASESRDGKMTTQEAMRAGYGVLASLTNQEVDNVVSVDTSDQPRFNFADSESARCSSTCLLQLPVKECGVKLRVHARDKGTVPVLLSVDTLRRMKAIVDYGNDQAVFAGINFQKCVALETTTTGHQILPLAQDFMQNSFPLSEPVRRIGVPASECEASQATGAREERKERGFPRVCPNMSSKEASAKTQGVPTSGIKAAGILNKAECETELASFGQVIPTGMTVPELRIWVRQVREQHGYASSRTNRDELMVKIHRANLRETQDLAKEMGVPFPSKVTMGEIKIRLRQEYMTTAPSNTVIDFGKHKGLSYEEIIITNPSYSTWAVGECMKKGDADHRLVMFAFWSIREGHVPNPGETNPELLKAGLETMGPLTLPVLLSKNLESEHSPGHDLSLKLRAHKTKGYASEAAGEEGMSKAEMMKIIQDLRTQVENLSLQSQASDSKKIHKPPAPERQQDSTM
ncbi:unnamed protein product, partial [Symbiodinium pilosum]